MVDSFFACIVGCQKSLTRYVPNIKFGKLAILAMIAGLPTAGNSVHSTIAR